MHSRNGSVRDREVSWDRKGPSFSTTLLDEIYRSIDGGTAREDCKRSRRKQQDEEEAKQRARLLEKWMEKKKVSGENCRVVGVRTEKNASSEKMELGKNLNLNLHYVENDPLFFSSGSNSSDSNSSLFSEHESIPLPAVKTRSSCFLPPKPIRTSVMPEKKTTTTGPKTEHVDVPASAKSRALKLYAHLKKMKQPISPGVKLTSFINSIFPNSKKPSNRTTTTTMTTTTSAAAKPTCSSASSFTRSCLNHQTTPSSSRTNSVNPSVPVNSDPIPTRPLKRDSQEQLRRQLIDSFRASPKPSSKIQPKPINTNVTRFSDDEDYAESDCSEDLFELDHLKLNRYSGELPVYQTTRLAPQDSNL